MIVLHPGAEELPSPTADRSGGRWPVDLTGTTFGVVGNRKFAFDQFVDLVARKLKEQTGVSGYVRVDKPSVAETVTDDALAPLVEQAHFAVTGLGD